VIAVWYLILFCICFDGVRTDTFVRPFTFGRESAHILTEYLSGISNDVCTSEMLGNAQALFQCGEVSFREGGQQGKPEALSGFFEAFEALLSLLSVSFVQPLLFREKRSLTEVIRFIHNKDGKK
jgi:hypothetical protein